MKQISTSLASKLKQDTIVERDYIIFSGETTRRYLWFNLYDDCYKDGNFIGTFVMKRIEITYNDSDLEFKNKEFNAYKEYKLDNETWESINYGTFVVTNVDPSDTKEEITVTAYDYALKFANTYKTDLDYASGKVTLFQVLQEVCQKVGVELENTSIENGNFIVDSNQFVEGSLFGNVITAIAQISCNFAKITPENKLKLLLKNESNVTIETKDYEEFEDKRDTLPYTAVSLGVSNVEGENVTLIAQGVDPDDAKYLTINDNPFAYTQEKRTQLIQAIFDKINGFGYSSFVLSNCLYPQLECGDLVQIKNKEGQSVDSIILRPIFEEVVLNFEAPSTITSSVSYVQPLDAIEISKRTEITVDKQNQTIKAVVESNQEVVSKTAQLSIEVDELKGQISEVADVTITADGYGIINAEKINVSEPIMLRIRPNGEDFALLYPRKNLYPSSNLYPKNRKITFENLTTNEKIEYIIPKDLWYLDNNNYDEFILDYENLQCYINRKIGVNADGTKYMLELPTTEELDYPTINLTEGDYKIYTNSFSNAYIYVRLMTQNIYTSQFATKVELSSSITQTSKEINLSVDKKIQDLDTQLSSDITQTSNSIMAEVNGKIGELDEDINAKLELKVDTENLVSEINASADVITLNSDRFILNSSKTQISQEGKLTCSDINITGGQFNIAQDINNTSTPIKIVQAHSTGTYRGQMGGAGTSYYKNDNTGIQLLIPPNSTSGYLYLYNTTNQNEYNFVSPTGIRTTSDIRYKENIKNIDQNISLEIIKSLNPITFVYKNGTEYHRGLSAQDLKEVLSKNNINEQVVTKDFNEVLNDEIYSINYTELIPDLINCIKNLNERIEKLERND